MRRCLPPLNAVIAFEAAARYLSFTEAEDHPKIKAFREWVLDEARRDMTE
jgi:DNA-binding transcriptional LysR family regulator